MSDAKSPDAHSKDRQSQDPRSQEEQPLPPTIPIFPLDGALLLPRMRLPLNIFEPRYLEMVRDALSGDRVIGMIQPRDPATYERAQKAEIYSIGCLGRITDWRETGDGRYLIALEGMSRFRVLRELDAPTGYRQVDVSYDEFPEDGTPAKEMPAIRQALLRNLKIYLERIGADVEWREIETTPDEQLINSAAMMCPFPGIEKQALLEAPTLEERAQVLGTLMAFSPEAQSDPPSTAH